MIEYPKMLYKEGGNLKLDGHYFDITIVNDKMEESEKIEAGWMFKPIVLSEVEKAKIDAEKKVAVEKAKIDAEKKAAVEKEAVAQAKIDAEKKVAQAQLKVKQETEKKAKIDAKKKVKQFGKGTTKFGNKPPNFIGK